jgi:hypothetical protein
MFPYSLGVLTMLQGVYSLLWIVLLMDVLSPTLDLRNAPQWPIQQTAVLVVALLTVSFVIGVAMHTVSRNLFRKMKNLWDLQIVTSAGVRRLFDDCGKGRPSGGPSLDEVHAAEGVEQVRKAGEFMHAVEYVLQVRAPQLHRFAQVYRDQYRLARGFVLPTLILTVVLPFWEPLPSGDIGRFPLISLQVFFLGIFLSGTCLYAFRERSFRYAAARLRGFLTLQGEQQREHTRAATAHLAAVS